jgi:hypothetical protein
MDDAFCVYASEQYQEKFRDHDCNESVEKRYDSRTNALRRIIEDEDHTLDGIWPPPIHTETTRPTPACVPPTLLVNLAPQQVRQDQKGNEAVEQQHFLGLHATVRGYAGCTVPAAVAHENHMDPGILDRLGVVKAGLRRHQPDGAFGIRPVVPHLS